MSAEVKLRIPRWQADELIAAFIFISYFCSDIFKSVITRLFGRGVFDPLFNILFISLIILFLATKKRDRLLAPLICYLIITVLFVATILIHPDYKDWYFERSYGIQIQFFRATGGIWAFLAVYLIADKEKLHQLLRICCLLLFVFLCFRFMTARARGYWVVYDANYNRIKLSYDLGFGYSMLFTVVFFAAEAYLHRKKLYYIPFAIGSVIILVSGSRGAIIWAVAVFIFMMPYRWGSMSRKERRRSLLLVILLVPLLWLFYLNYEELSQGLVRFLARHGISSRSLNALLSGEFSEANGRDTIYKITIERIKEGGWLGNGVFGERTAVGQKFRWGYAHNIVLEVYAAFGYLGGTIVMLALIVSIISTAIRSKTPIEQVIFITFFGTSMKLLLSDSFWFNSSFWALLAIMVMWRKDNRSVSIVMK